MDNLMMPDLQFSILCDDVVQDRLTGKLVLHGIFSNIEGKKLPLNHPRCFIVNGWCNGMGSFRQQTKILDPQKEPIIEDRFTDFTLAENRSKHTVIAQFNNISFNNEGTYWVEIYLNDRLILSYPFEVKSKPAAPPA